MKDLVLGLDVVDAQADLLGSWLDDGWLRLYDGRKPPAGPDAPIEDGQRLLVSLRFGRPAFKSARNGEIAAHPLALGVVTTSGTASWYRCFRADGTSPVMDGTVGTADANMILESIDLVEGTAMGIMSFSHLVPQR